MLSIDSLAELWKNYKQGASAVLTATTNNVAEFVRECDPHVTVSTYNEGISIYLHPKGDDVIIGAVVNRRYRSEKQLVRDYASAFSRLPNVSYKKEIEDVLKAKRVSMQGTFWKWGQSRRPYDGD